MVTMNRQCIEQMFWHPFKDKLKWDAIPLDFLYDLYLSWCRTYGLDGFAKDSFEFNVHLVQIAKQDGWSYSEHIRTSDFRGVVEPLITAYDLKDWRPDSLVDKEYAGIVRKA